MNTIGKSLTGVWLDDLKEESVIIDSDFSLLEKRVLELGGVKELSKQLNYSYVAMYSKNAVKDKPLNVELEKQRKLLLTKAVHSNEPWKSKSKLQGRQIRKPK